MAPEEFEKRLDVLKHLGCNAKMALFAYDETAKEIAIFFPNEEGDSVSDVASKLATLFKTVLVNAWKQSDKRQFEILRDAMACAIMPYITGCDDRELIGTALLGEK